MDQKVVRMGTGMSVVDRVRPITRLVRAPMPTEVIMTALLLQLPAMATATDPKPTTAIGMITAHRCRHHTAVPVPTGIAMIMAIAARLRLHKQGAGIAMKRRFVIISAASIADRRGRTAVPAVPARRRSADRKTVRRLHKLAAKNADHRPLRRFLLQIGTAVRSHAMPAVIGAAHRLHPERSNQAPVHAPKATLHRHHRLRENAERGRMDREKACELLDTTFTNHKVQIAIHRT